MSQSGKKQLHPAEEKWLDVSARQLEKGICSYKAEDELLSWYFYTFCMGYRAGKQRENGWFRERKPRLYPREVAKYLGLQGAEPSPFSVSPANETNWIVIDIDTNSKYHSDYKNPEGIKPVKAVLREIGLNSAVEFQSSENGGIHLWYPLIKYIKAWTLATGIRQHLESKNLEIKDGTLEIFPSTRRYDKLEKGIRAPLSGRGNSFVIDGYGLIDDLKVFRREFIRKSKKNRIKLPEASSPPIASSSSYTRGPFTENSEYSFEKCQERLDIGFTGRSQTQIIAFSALVLARMAEGIDNEAGLRRRCSELVTACPGYSTHCGHQRQIENGGYWCKKVIEDALAYAPCGYKDTWKEKANVRRHDDARERAHEALRRTHEADLTYNSMRQAVESMQKLYGAPARSWWSKPENEDLCEELKNLLISKK